VAQGVNKPIILDNGGDGLVCSRYLKDFGYDVDIYYPKRVNSPFFNNLIKLCENYEIPILEDNLESIIDKYSIIIDSIFGYSFKGDLRAPFDKIIKTMGETKAKIVSVDVPSGWIIDEGNTKNTFNPDVLVSLMVPKLCAEKFDGIHYLGGRFIPKQILDKYNIEVKEYKNSDLFVRLD
jgi:NAD(P)H-hydrate epimerase